MLALSALLCATVLTVVPSVSDEPAQAAGFDPGYIISDALFFNPNTMNETQIQTFLNGQVASCGAGSSCLRNYRQNTASRAATAYCSGYPAGTNESAALIIKKVATICGVNPQVLLVTLQKEQGLITAANPSSFQMRAAMGYGCPDTAPCDAQFYGFFNQVYQAATAFKRYAANPQNYRYKAGANNAVLYHPNAACGSSTVFIRNQATAGLYVYTPYQPNAAALAAGFGTGNSCSSYGNRNFYNYFTKWFGSPNGATQVRAKLEAVSGTSGGIQLSGWAFDEGVTAPVNIRTTVNGKLYSQEAASALRADVKRAYPLQSDRHGFTLNMPSPIGTSTVCVTAVNAGSTRSTNLGCRSVKVTADAGTLTGRSAVLEATARGVKAEGWVVTGASGTGGRLHFYVNGKYTSMHMANKASSDLKSFFPAATTNLLGYSEVLPRAVGTYNVCTYAVNAAGTAKVALKCADITVTTQTPVGRFESATVSGSTASVNGWAFDPATVNAIAVRVTLNGVAVSDAVTTATRTDVQRVYSAQGVTHGYQVAVPGLKEGANTVCVQAVNVQKDKTADLGCKTVTRVAAVPQGKLEAASVLGTTLSASGWAFDPTSTASTRVDVTVDGGPAVPVTANVARPDVKRAYPAQGSAHGFGYTTTLAAGTHQVCATARSLSGAGSRALGCKTVTVSAAKLDGRLDSATVSGANVVVSGWGFEAGVKAPVNVSVSVNGKLSTTALANVPRSDVQRVYPAQGPTHGYSLTVPLPAGKSTVCTSVISANGARTAQVGCKTVTR
ncbi:hypothetical protein GCM10022198_10030 [Klugiella xanthotipulae]|uniref:hypothetical protein n=1 Tax=Klugiella xanthotipulae TaxID=244735 RepID=UPI001151FFF5|nr:hypothetical protein [Klugiella xanthotipulae]